MNIIHINKEIDYITKFHDLIDPSDKETLGMSNHSINFYRSFYKYEEKPVKAIEVNGEIVSVLFYSIPKRDNYVTILNIITPVKYRQKGYAKKLMQEAVSEAYGLGKRRLRMNCDFLENTIIFYNRLNCLYIGMTKQNALYCNVPLLSDKLEDFSKLKDLPLAELMDESSVRLAKRRMSPSESQKLYANPPSFVDMSKYRHKEFIELYGEF